MWGPGFQNSYKNKKTTMYKCRRKEGGRIRLGVVGISPETVKGQNFQGGDVAKHMPCGFKN